MCVCRAGAQPGHWGSRLFSFSDTTVIHPAPKGCMAGTSVALSTVLRVPLWLWMPLLLSCLLFLLPYSWGCLKVQTNIY